LWNSFLEGRVSVVVFLAMYDFHEVMNMTLTVA
jgi:hypothetical protein